MNLSNVRPVFKSRWKKRGPPRPWQRRNSPNETPSPKYQVDNVIRRKRYPSHVAPALVRPSPASASVYLWPWHLPTDKKGVGCRCLVEEKNTPVIQKEEAVKPVKSWRIVLVPTKLLLEWQLWRLHREVEESLREFKSLKDEEIPLELMRAIRLGPEFASPRFPLYDNPALARLCLAVCKAYENDNAEVGRQGLKSYVFPLLERHPSLWYTAAPILLDGRLPGQSEEFQEARDKYVDCIAPAREIFDCIGALLNPIAFAKMHFQFFRGVFRRAIQADNDNDFLTVLLESLLIEYSCKLGSFLLASRCAVGRKALNMTEIFPDRPNMTSTCGVMYFVCSMSVAVESFIVRFGDASKAKSFRFLIDVAQEVLGPLRHLLRESLQGPDPHFLPLYLAVLWGQKDMVSFLQAKQDTGAANLGAGNAYKACVQDASNVVRLQAYKVPVEVSGGGLAYHSLVVATLSSGKGFVLEKCADHRADQDQFKNGVLVSDVMNVRYFGEQYANLQIAKDINVRASDIRQTMVETGPYSVDRANCQHAVDAVLKKFSSTEQEWVPKPNEKAIGLLQIIIDILYTWFGSSCKDGSERMSRLLVSSGLATASERFVFGRTATE